MTPQRIVSSLLASFQRQISEDFKRLAALHISNRHDNLRQGPCLPSVGSYLRGCVFR